MLSQVLSSTLVVGASIFLAWVLASFGPLAAIVVFLVYLNLAANGRGLLTRRRPRRDSM
jgi:hypothetical protein